MKEEKVKTQRCYLRKRRGVLCVVTVSLPCVTPRANLNRLLDAISPDPYEEPPPVGWRSRPFLLVKHHWFDRVVMAAVAANTMCMAMEHRGQGERCVAAGCGVQLLGLLLLSSYFFFPYT